MPTAPQPDSALYTTIHEQPSIVRAVLERTQTEAGQAAAILARARRIYLAGTGTSSHAAVVGEHLLRAAGADAHATTNFDFVSYPRPRGAEDALIAISHRGSKRYGTQAIARAHEAGMPVIGITGQQSPMEGVDVLIQTAPQERSSTHTASYTANLAALALVAVHAGERMGAGVQALRNALAHLPEHLETMLAQEARVRPVAEALAARGRAMFVGAGPNAVTAREGALKVKESSYLVAEGIELETALHGCLPAVEAGDVATVIAAQGAALERTGELLGALHILGARLLVIADQHAVSNLPVPEGATVIPYPGVPEPLSPILAIVPLQLLAAYTAQLRGTNADSFRADQPVYKRANESYAL
ncbi:MAG TPA: SIS domain-containing protein [Chloroflexota bacterium]|nr:SIS domain-containing protein [Chloroflexota bacterium]